MHQMFSAETGAEKLLLQKINKGAKINPPKSKIIEKRSGKRLKPNELIKKATSNLNKPRSVCECKNNKWNKKE